MAMIPVKKKNKMKKYALKQAYPMTGMRHTAMVAKPQVPHDCDHE